MHNTLTVRILAPFLTCIVLAVICVGILSGHLAEEMLMENMYNTQHDFVVQIERNFSGMAEKVLDIVTALCYDEQLYKLLSENAESSYQALNRQRQIVRIIDRARLFSPRHNFNVFLYNRAGEIYESSKYYSSYGKVIDALSLEEYGAMLDSQETGVVWLGCAGGLYTDTRSLNTIHAVKRLNWYASAQQSGLLVVELAEQDVLSAYRDSLTRGDMLYIVDDEGRVVSSSDRSAIGQICAFWRGEFIQNDGRVRHHLLSLNGAEHVVTIKRNTATGWHIVDVLPYEPMVRSAGSIMRIALLVSCALLCVCIPLVLFNLHRVIRPIRDLCRHMSDVGEQLAPIGAPHPITQEMAALYEGYDAMMTRLKENEEAALRQQEEMRKAELRALQAQINPHFLYNTLSAIRFLAQRGDAASADRMIVSLSRLLRGVLGETDSMIPLWKEIDFLKAYFDILSLRFNGNISLHIQVDDACADCALPRLVLQPIVENALLHGLSGEGVEGCVLLNATRVAERVRIGIVDNGSGMSEDALETLKNRLENGQRQGFSHVGLSNVYERLRFALGQSAKVEITSVERAGTSVTLDIPYRRATEEGTACTTS